MIVKRNIIICFENEKALKILKSIILNIAFTLMIVFVLEILFYSGEKNEYSINQVSVFKSDVNKLTEVALILEFERSSNNYRCNSFGTIGDILYGKDLGNNVSLILEKHFNKKLEDDDYRKLEIRRLNGLDYKKIISENHLQSLVVDENYSNYVIITKGSMQGNIIYVGDKNISDSSNRYFGLEFSILRG